MALMVAIYAEQLAIIYALENGDFDFAGITSETKVLGLI